MDPKLAASLSNFAFRFCNEQPNDKTLICSPLSAEVVLALTALGSAGDTHAELLRTMDLPDDEAVRSLFGFLTSTLKSVADVTLRIANRVYVTNKGVLKPCIKKDVEEVFDSGLEQLDFTQREAAADIMNKWSSSPTLSSSPALPINGSLKPCIKKDAEEVFDSGLEQLDFTQRKADADIMNKWVAEQTDNMIQKVLSPSSLNEKTSLVLVNAIYFQGLWENPFSKRATREWPFHVNSTTDMKVAMMSKRSQNFRYKHSPELKAKILQMFYTGGKASMIFVLPDEIEGLNEMLQQLASGHDLMSEIEGLRTTLCDVMIPKFKVETDINLNKLLPKMGIKQIFDEFKSDIWMLANQKERLFVSNAVQKAVIEVDEAGTKAAVRTSFPMEMQCSIGRKFRADHPFLYLLMAGDVTIYTGIYKGCEFVRPKLKRPKLPTGVDDQIIE